MTSTMVMSMNMASMTATATAATASTTALSMSMGDSSCKISMLWNWYTVDSCFISSTWHVTSTGMFAGSCIGVVMLVMSLEFLRRAAKEYDQYLLRQATKSIKSPSQSSVNSTTKASNDTPDTSSPTRAPRSSNGKFRPNIFQQMIRAGLHMVQFAVAYFIMLLAMYYNGYIIICIIIGAFLGSFTFSWEIMKLGDAKDEVTFCCG